MSDHKDTKTEIIDLLPSEITTDPKFDVRPYERHATGEWQLRNMEEVELLADSIEANGQLDAICITPERVLVCGHRRRKAVIILNERHTILGQPLVKLRCAVDRSGGDLVLKAFASNAQRRNLSPVDIAYFIHQFRTERRLYNCPKGVAMTTKLLHLQRQTVIKSEKIMQSSKEIQHRLHEGAISTDTALLLIHADIPADQLVTVFRRSQEIQQENQTAKLVDDVQAKRKTQGRATKELTQLNGHTRIQKPAVVQALREYRSTPAQATATRKITPLTLPDLLKALAAADTPSMCRPARKLIRYFLREFATGRSTQAELERQLALACGDDPVAAQTPLQSAACY